MNSGEDYLNKRYYSMQIPDNQDFNYNTHENYENISNQDNPDILLEKMETTLNTFLNNLKKDDIPNYPNINKNINNQNIKTQKKNNLIPKQINYNKQQNNININRNNNNNNYYNQQDYNNFFQHFHY